MSTLWKDSSMDSEFSAVYSLDPHKVLLHTSTWNNHLDKYVPVVKSDTLPNGIAHTDTIHRAYMLIHSRVIVLEVTIL